MRIKIGFTYDTELLYNNNTHIEVHMGFNSWEDFRSFKDNVKYSNRYIQSREVKEFLFNIEKTLSNREYPLPPGAPLFRGQIGCDELEIEGQLALSCFEPSRMKPLINKGTEGRGNPKGISYLYLSDDENTALSELRPHLDQYISLAMFRTKRKLRIIDCISKRKHYSLAECVFNPPQSQDDMTDAIWSMINDAFSTPVTNLDNESDYVPTQILAELIKYNGYDGLCFKSSIGQGANFILFNLEDAEIINRKLMKPKTINYEFQEVKNPCKSNDF